MAYDSDPQLLPARQLDQRDVRILPHPLEHDPPPIRRHVEAPERLAWPQAGQSSTLPRCQVEQPEVLAPEPAELHHQPLAVGKKPVAVANAIDRDLREWVWPAVRRDRLHWYAPRARGSRVHDEFAVR